MKLSDTGRSYDSEYYHARHDVTQFSGGTRWHNTEWSYDSRRGKPRRDAISFSGTAQLNCTERRDRTERHQIACSGVTEQNDTRLHAAAWSNLTQRNTMQKEEDDASKADAEAGRRGYLDGRSQAAGTNKQTYSDALGLVAHSVMCTRSGYRVFYSVGDR